MNKSHPQKPLILPLQASYSLGDFVCGENSEIPALLSQLASGDKHFPVWYLWGVSASGKSHLIQAVVQQAQHNKQNAVAIDLAQPQIDTRVLAGLEHFDLVCLDHLDAIIAQKNWQEALFHLINRMMPKQSVLLVAAQKNVAELQLALADLASRLSWGINLQLKALADADKVLVLQQQAKRRGFYLQDDVANYLLKHYSRDLKQLDQYLSLLNKSSLSEQCKVTIPFVRKKLSLFLHKTRPSKA